MNIVSAIRPRAAAPTVLLALTLMACEGADGPPDERPLDASPPADGTEVDRATGLPPGAETISLLGDPLDPPQLPEDVRARYEANLEEARAEAEAAPEDVDALIWLGRRLAYLGRYREAIDVFGRGLELAPADARLYRHRGHRYLTLRRFDEAVTDLRRAAELVQGTEDEVEPDGIPNARGIPTSTLHFNIWYHLALAHYLQGDRTEALLAWNECMGVSKHPDSVVATAYWLQNTLRRLGMTERADAALESIYADMNVIESTQYLDVLMLWKRERSVDDLQPPGGPGDALAGVTVAYGVGNWHYVQGRTDEAFRVWDEILQREGQWAAFGYIAAEAEVAARRAEGAGAGQGAEGAGAGRGPGSP